MRLFGRRDDVAVRVEPKGRFPARRARLLGREGGACAARAAVANRQMRIAGEPRTEPLLESDFVGRPRAARLPCAVESRGGIDAEEPQMPRLVLVARLRIDGGRMVRASNASGSVLTIVRVNRIRDNEPEAPCMVVDPLAAARATESVAENPLAGLCALVGPFLREHVERRAELVLAVSREGALLGGLAEAPSRLLGHGCKEPPLRP